MSTLNETVWKSLLSENHTHTFSKKLYPFYYSPSPSLIRGVSDNILILLLPIVAYWLYSLLFYLLDTAGWEWPQKHRINSSEKGKSRNIPTGSQVFWGVVFQQVLQTILGLFWLSDKGSHLMDHQAELLRITYTIGPTMHKVMGEAQTNVLLPDIAYFVYWWGIPIAKLATAMHVLILVHITSFDSLVA